MATIEENLGNIKVALLGGEEFKEGFEDVLAFLLNSLSDRKRKTVVFLPTCSAENGEKAVTQNCNEARAKLSVFGADVETPLIIDRESANDAENARLVANADLIYFGGGYPHVAINILSNTLVMAALQNTLSRGTLICGASAGAMLMGTRSWVCTPEFNSEIEKIWGTGVPNDHWAPSQPPCLEGLNLIPQTLIWPHFNRTYSRHWLKQDNCNDGLTVVGIDEQTALVNLGNGWKVYGRGHVTIIHKDYIFLQAKTSPLPI